MDKNYMFHTADNNRLSVVVSKISAFSYDTEKQTLHIFVTGDKEEFVCRYDTQEELMIAVDRLKKLIYILEDRMRI